MLRIHCFFGEHLHRKAAGFSDVFFVFISHEFWGKAGFTFPENQSIDPSFKRLKHEETVGDEEDDYDYELMKNQLMKR